MCLKTTPLWEDEVTSTPVNACEHVEYKSVATEGV